jgi:hypothetical protein
VNRDDDRRGIFVPLWAMDECDGNARDAMVLAQISWWFQPSQRDGSARTKHLVERDGRTWLYTTDDELGDELGMTRDQVWRARAALKKAGLILSRAGNVNYRKVTLVSPTARPSPSAEPRDTKREVAQDQARNRANASAESRNALHTRTAEEEREDLLPVARATDDPVKAQAHRLAVLAMEQPVKPIVRGSPNPFPAVMALIERALRAGRPVADVERAVARGVDVWTANGLNTAIALARRPLHGTEAIAEIRRKLEAGEPIETNLPLDLLRGAR